MELSTKPRILILDDEPGVRYAFEDFILELGYDIVGLASTTEEALEVFKKTFPDIALLDINIDDQENGGIEVAQQIQKIRPTPIIYITGYAEQNFDYAVETFPANFLAKPIVNKEQLKHPIELALHNFWGASFRFPNLVGHFGWLHIRKNLEKGFDLRIHQTDVRYGKASNNDIELYYGEKVQRVYISSQKFNETLKVLPPSLFLKVNRFHFVNITHTILRNNNEVFIEGEEENIIFKISSNNKKNVLAKLR